MASSATAPDPRWEEVEQHRPASLRLLGRTFPGLAAQHDDIFNEVATRLFERSKGQGFWPETLQSYLLGAVAKNAAHELRTAKQRDTHPSDPQLGELARLAGEPLEELVLGELDAENYRSIIRSLNGRQRAVAKLRFDWGLPASQIAELLEIDVQRCYKDLRRATAKVRRKARKVRAGEHVREWERLFDRYLAGSATAAQQAEARLLLDTNPQARSIAVAMYRQASRLAELLPLPPLAASAHGQSSRLADLLEASRQQLTDGAAAARQPAEALARVDVTEIARVRPGAAAAAIVGCLAIGGGAGTYCLERNINPLSSLPGVGESQEQQREPPRETKAEEPPPEPAPVTVAPTPPAPVETIAAPEPAPEPAPAPPPPPPDPEPTPAPIEFGEPASAPPAQAAQPRASEPAQPAPAPRGGSDFGP